MTADIYAQMRDVVLSALPPAIALDEEIKKRINVGPPRDPSRGDMTTNAAMVMATYARKNPRELASLIVDELRKDLRLTDVEVANPGFINMRLQATAFHALLPDILRVGEAYGDSDHR